MGNIIEHLEKMRAEKWFRSVSQYFRDLYFELNILENTFGIYGAFDKLLDLEWIFMLFSTNQ